MRLWQHYKALMFKNWILWKRRLFGSLCEILFPLFLLLMLLLIRTGISSDNYDAKSYIGENGAYVNAYDSPEQVNEAFTKVDPLVYCKEYLKGIDELQIDLAPKGNPLIEAMKEWLEDQIADESITVVTKESDDDIEDYVTASDYEDEVKLCFAVVVEDFQDNTSSGGGVKVDYKFRYNATELIPDDGRIGEFYNIFYIDDYESYDELISEPKPQFQEEFLGSSFVHIQNFVHNYILREVLGQEEGYIATGMAPMYHDDYIVDDFVFVIRGTLPFFLLISFVIPVCRMISLIVSEKEYKMKETMMIMGLSNSAYWLSWLTYYFIVYTVIAIFGTLITGPEVFKYSSVFYIFLMFWLYGLSCLAFSVLMSMFFSRSRTALLMGIMVFFASYFISFAVEDANVSQGEKIAASLLPNIAFSLSAGVLAEFEKGQVGIQPDNSYDVVNNYSFGIGILFLFLDTVIFILLAFYLEEVWPTEWGTKRKWYFPFQKSFWCKTDQEEHQNDIVKHVKWPDNVEPVDPSVEKQKDSNKALLVRNLTKAFGNKLAVDMLDLDIYEGQIFALLGHNGAGKTTTISMMTGLIPPTSGEMTVDGLYLSSDLSKLRKRIGVCPQQNVLYKELTPEEHLYLFCVFKGLDDKNVIKEKVDEKIQEVDLETRRGTKVQFLSGGQKRKLSLAIALIADSPVVLLDEPTSGMDLTARRQMWDMLKNNKSNRIIILTTHYMEEADVLADRIAIMSEGTLRCCGSSLFLKSRYGVGYYLTMVKEENVSSPQHTKTLESYIKRYIPDARIMSDVHAEISFQLPSSGSESFKDFFSDLDRSLGKLSVRSYGVSVTTLEEVFLRVARGDEDIRKKGETPKEEEDIKFIKQDFTLERDRIKGILFFNHFVSLVKKRIFITRRDVRSLICEILVPILLVLSGLALMMIASRFYDQDSLTLELDNYQTPQTIYYSTETGVDPSSIIGQFNSQEATAESVTSSSVTDFDRKLLDKTDDGESKSSLGAYYFFKVDSANHQYETAMFTSHKAYQAVGTFHNLIGEAILKSINPEVEITVKNHPLPFTEDVKTLEGTGDGFIASLIFSLGFAFIPAGIISFTVKEREVNVKHQHMISGVSLGAYWFSNFAWDMLKHMIPAIVCPLLILAFGVEILTDPQESYTAVWLLMILYGLCVIPFTYCTSFFFKNYSTAQILTILLHFVTGSIFPTAILIMYFFDETRDAAKGLTWVLRVFPNFCFGMGILNLGNRELFAALNGDSVYDPLSLDSAGADVLFLAIMTPVYLLLVVLGEFIETNPKFMKLFSFKSKVAPKKVRWDEDVEREMKKAEDADPQETQINVKDIRKAFGNVVAVEKISFSVEREECFAFLGVNGAGKTTTFKMLTGEVAPTSGTAYVGGYDVVKDLSKTRELIGYCPQFDAISELLTGKEHLNLYADIKGVPKDRKEQLVEDMLQDMDLYQYKDLKAGAYSGGNKRKLSVAMALIGNPSVIFLDEPSAGMDPEARKKMWKVIGNIKKRNSAVILTTHSMEEAEALSDRMGIMVAGRFRCIGTAMHIKNKFGYGYELEIKVGIPPREEVVAEASKLKSIATPENYILENQFQAAMEILEARELLSQVSAHGFGSSIHYSLVQDKKVGVEQLASWVIIEKIGQRVMEWLQTEFQDVSLIEHYLSLYTFKIGKQADKSIGYFFSAIEGMKNELRISEYSVCQTSLEQIFNNFAKRGEDDYIE